MSSVCVPIDPVDPSKEIFFTFPFPNSNANSSGVGVAVPGQHAPYRDSLLLLFLSLFAITFTHRLTFFFNEDEKEEEEDFLPARFARKEEDFWGEGARAADDEAYMVAFVYSVNK
jgi:hypothetical protein